MEWSAVRSFEEARRDVPVEWEIRSIGSLDGGVQISLASAGMELRAESGAGPILPVTGLYQVTGWAVLDGDSLEVRGLVRHVQR